LRRLNHRTDRQAVHNRTNRSRYAPPARTIVQESLMLIRVAPIAVAAALSLPSLTAFPRIAVARDISVEFLRAYDLDPSHVCRLSDLAGRNFGKIVHLEIAISWSKAKADVETSGYQRLIFWDERAEYLFPKGSYEIQHGSYVVRGYFIPRSGGIHQGIISLAFERADDASVLLNPNVVEVEVGARVCDAGQATQARIPPSKATSTASAAPTISSARSIPMKRLGGAYAVPVLINNAITL